jgi:acyl carrier protein
VRIWEDVLEYAPVTIDENFFAAGGDSLRAIRVMVRIEAELGVTMSLDTLLFAPTIRELAQAMLAQRDGPQRNRIVALQNAITNCGTRCHRRQPRTGPIAIACCPISRNARPAPSTSFGVTTTGRNFPAILRWGGATSHASGAIPSAAITQRFSPSTSPKSAKYYGVFVTPRITANGDRQRPEYGATLRRDRQRDR